MDEAATSSSISGLSTQGAGTRGSESRRARAEFRLQTEDNRVMPAINLTAIDSNALPWEERPNENRALTLS